MDIYDAKLLPVGPSCSKGVKRYPVTQKINLYPVYNAIGFPNTYPLDSDLFDGCCQPMIKQLGPDLMQIFSRLEIHLSIINFVAQHEILGKNGFNLV